ncbi:ROK family protein [Luethyella okanaganae]|uniref:ROK family protein n=1 Tax=Luethyella okanaganae TaxID=69372 RepID=A0ABW1VGY7_9MICO
MPNGTVVSPWLRDSPGALLGLFRASTNGLTKSEAVRRSGLSRTAINQRLSLLLAARLLQPTDVGARTGGRPADRFHLNRDQGVILIADTGATGMRVALCDMVAAVLEEAYERIDITDGPAAVLSRVKRLFDEFLDRQGRTPSEVLGIGIDVPGPVDHDSGRVVSPPIMTGWHDFDISAYFRPHYECPVIVEKDVNAMAFGEHRLVHADTSDIVFVKLGTGVGTGLVIDGEIYRGADGAAGDVGHIPLEANATGTDAPVCRCGNLGCIEAYAGGWALVRDLKALGRPVDSIDDVIREALEGRQDATRLMRQAATIIGTAVSDLVNILNPRTIVIGGQLAAVQELLFAGVREVVYRRSLPLATRELRIVPSALDGRAGVHGLARLVTDEVYSVERINRLVGTLSQGVTPVA